MASTPFRTKIALLFVFSAAIQLIAGWLFLFRADVPSLDIDEQEYWTLSSNILTGAPLDIGRRTLGHPILLAGLRTLADNIQFVQSCVAVLAATAAPLLALLVRKLTKSDAGALLAGVGLALWPPQVFYASSLYSETLALPVFLAFLLLLPLDLSAKGKFSARSWLLAGAVLGIAAHIRPMYQLFLPMVPIVLWLDSRAVRVTLVRSLLVVAGFCAVILPWSVYVSDRLDHPIFLSDNGGETLAGGFNPRIIGRGERHYSLVKRSTWDGPGKWIPVDETGYLSDTERRLPYVVQNRLLQQRSMAWIRDNPGDAAYLAWRKLAYMWGIYPFSANGWLQALFGNVPTIALALLTMVALARNQQIRRRCARCYLLPLFVTGVALISWGSWRFRLPADAGMIAVVAAFLASSFKFGPSHPNLGARPCTTS